MIFKLKFPEKTKFAKAKNVYDLQEKYSDKFGVNAWLEVILITTITNKEAKKIMFKNIDTKTLEECSEFSLYDIVVNNNFVIIDSTEQT